MQSNYPRVLANTLVEEGGWSNDPHDPGGATMRGVIQARYDEYRVKWGKPKQTVRNISEVELQEIYADGYWKPIDGPNHPKGIDQLAFDICVNSGPGRAAAILAASLGTGDKAPRSLSAKATLVRDKVALAKNICARRGSFYRSLGTFKYFGKGWMSRNARMEAIAVKMVLEAEKLPAPVVQKKLEDEAAAAGKTKKTAGKIGGAAGAAGAGGTATPAVPTDAAWDWSTWLMMGGFVLVMLGIAGGCWWLYRRHGERLTAYLESAAGSIETSLEEFMAKVKAA